LPRICQVVGHFLAHRRRRANPSQCPLAALLGVWRHARPLETVTALSDPGAPGGPLVSESFGHESEWFVCWLAADLGDQGEMEALNALLDLLREATASADSGQSGQFAPCLPPQWPPDAMTDLASRPAQRFPGEIDRCVKQAPDSDRLLPV
ncbi:MAG: hypothetical protein ABEJ96_05995, partial [Thiohalorhabdaceae bacterium]